MDKRTQDKYLETIYFAYCVGKRQSHALRELEKTNRSKRSAFEAAATALIALGFYETVMEAMNNGYQIGKEDALAEQVERHTVIHDFVQEKEAEKPLGKGLKALIPANNDFEPQNTEWGNIGMGLNKADREVAV